MTLKLSFVNPGLKNTERKEYLAKLKTRTNVQRGFLARPLNYKCNRAIYACRYFLRCTGKHVCGALQLVVTRNTMYDIIGQEQTLEIRTRISHHNHPQHYHHHPTLYYVNRYENEKYCIQHRNMHVYVVYMLILCPTMLADDLSVSIYTCLQEE